MVSAGAEILVETARFWASRAQVDDPDGRAHIRQVIGPDEYHEFVDDNAYTNVMAAFNLERAADAAAILRREQPGAWQLLSARLGLSDSELPAWRAWLGSWRRCSILRPGSLSSLPTISSSKRSMQRHTRIAPRR
jgi:trehalose/maltose hydrolase-like predicted phosphorylase